MKRLFFTLVFLFFIYFSLQALFYYFGPGHTINYVVDDFNIEEEYINNQNNEIQSYYFSITKNDLNFNIQIFEDFGNEDKIINEIKSVNYDNIYCILPIFKGDKVLTDLICYNDNIIYNYKDLEHINSNILEFYVSIRDKFFKENLKSEDKRENVILYQNNMQPNYYFSINTYKGFMYANGTNKVLNSKIIYDNDVYDNFLSIYLNKNYVTVNYDEKYGFTKVYIYNIMNGSEEVITLKKTLEKNSYIQGFYNNSLFIFDRNNKIQYEVNTESKTVLEVGNVDTGVKIYKNGTMTRVSAHECASNDVLFEEKKELNLEYKFLSKTGGNKTGYSYYYKKNGDEYSIYRTNNNHNDQYTYLFKTSNLDRIITINEYIYFVDNNYIKYYSDKTGICSLVYNRELSFNKNIKYQIIYQK